MLMDQGSLRRRVAEAVHQLTHRGTGLGGHGRTCVPEVVEPDVAPAHRFACA